ncbi:60s acidic ribosomal protein-domain-containing protein [Hyaloraphidium curvatum]|nr:60s acidic ribosomal protein-domain-containing protein [Hyaloraphidium curvatum]
MAGTLEVSEAATVYAALILHDAELEITADKIQALIDAAGVEVDSAYPKVFAKALAGKDLSQLLGAIAVAAPSAGAAPAAAAAPSGGAAAAAEAPAAKKEEKKEEEEEEGDEDMGFGLFD